MYKNTFSNVQVCRHFAILENLVEKGKKVQLEFQATVLEEFIGYLVIPTGFTQGKISEKFVKFCEGVWRADQIFKLSLRMFNRGVCEDGLKFLDDEINLILWFGVSEDRNFLALE